MPSLKEIRNKISSVKSTKRIMQAMKMIATVKYAKTQVMIGSYRPYYDAYKKIISTRGYQDRIKTINNVRKAGITVCSGGIIGMGESEKDRASMLYTLYKLDPYPESVPINALVPVKGTPMENKIKIWENKEIKDDIFLNFEYLNIHR